MQPLEQMLLFRICWRFCSTLYQVILAHCTTGAAAASDIARAIRWLNADGRAEVLLIGRGGGSADSLSAFDEEVVVGLLPIHDSTVVAVGHGLDHCLADLVADLVCDTSSCGRGYHQANTNATA